MQLIAEKEILIVVASHVGHCCAIKKNVIVASQLYDIADEQFTHSRERRSPWTFTVYSKV